MIIAHLSRPPPTLRNDILQSLEPVVYWADFLDLQARGPVPWKMEITDGIRACSKFVAFIDFAWLTSYNCLQASLNNNRLSRITCIPITCIPPRCLGLSIFTAWLCVHTWHRVRVQSVIRASSTYIPVGSHFRIFSMAF